MSRVSLKIYFITKTDHPGKNSMYVVRELTTNFLGLLAIITLNLASRIDIPLQLLIINQQWQLKVFIGLGNLRNLNIIKLAQDAVPHAIYTPKTVALSINLKYKR